MDMEWKTIVNMAIHKALVLASGWFAARGLISGAGLDQFVAAGTLIVSIGWESWQKYGMVMISGKLAKLKGIPLPGEPTDRKLGATPDGVPVKSSAP